MDREHEETIDIASLDRVRARTNEVKPGVGATTPAPVVSDCVRRKNQMGFMK